MKGWGSSTWQQATRQKELLVPYPCRSRSCSVSFGFFKQGIHLHTASNGGRGSEPQQAGQVAGDFSGPRAGTVGAHMESEQVASPTIPHPTQGRLLVHETGPSW